MCEHCKHKDKDINEHPCVTCCGYDNFIAKNNFHNVKAMSIEELSEFLYNIATGYRALPRNIDRWLRSEVTDNE